jgi:hypothetical protein
MSSELKKIEMFLMFDLACLTSFGYAEDGVSIDKTVVLFLGCNNKPRIQLFHF